MTLRPAPLAADVHLADPVTSWTELADLLRDDWLSLRDGRDRCLIRLPDALGLVEQPGLLRARERRGLHRRGFRLQRAGGLRVWVWVPPDDDPADPRDLAASLRRWSERSEALGRTALQTVREVLGAEVHEVRVVLLPPEEEDDDLWDDGEGAVPCPRWGG